VLTRRGPRKELAVEWCHDVLLRPVTATLFVGRRNAKKVFAYLAAGSGAQPEVKKAIARFRKLPAAERKKYPSLWGWLLGKKGTPPYKIDREWIQWAQHPVRGQKCANCQRWYIHYATQTGICDSLSGSWKGDWWCERWVMPLSAQDYKEYQR
jgi:hypothetical protein